MIVHSRNAAPRASRWTWDLCQLTSARFMKDLGKGSTPCANAQVLVPTEETWIISAMRLAGTMVFLFCSASFGSFIRFETVALFARICPLFNNPMCFHFDSRLSI